MRILSINIQHTIQIYSKYSTKMKIQAVFSRIISICRNDTGTDTTLSVVVLVVPWFLCGCIMNKQTNKTVSSQIHLFFFFHFVSSKFCRKGMQFIVNFQ